MIILMEMISDLIVTLEAFHFAISNLPSDVDWKGG